jgi:hypothetical protein
MELTVAPTNVPHLGATNYLKHVFRVDPLLFVGGLTTVQYACLADLRYLPFQFGVQAIRVERLQTVVLAPRSPEATGACEEQLRVFILQEWLIARKMKGKKLVK